MAETADRASNHALRSRYEEIHGQYQRLRMGLDELQQRLADLAVTARSDDGMVTATVGARGQLLRLAFDRRAYTGHEPSALAEKATATVRRAAELAARRVQDLVAEHLPAGSGVAEFMRDGRFDALVRRADAVLDEARDD